MKPQRLEWYARLLVMVVVVVVALTVRGLNGWGLGAQPGEASRTGIAAPTGLVAATGGGSIALRWSPVTMPVTASKYKIYRNSNQVATISAVGAPAYTMSGTIYYDSAVTAGRSYTYQVIAVSATGATSVASQALTVKLGSLITPVPTVTLQNAGQSDLDTTLADGATMIKNWYPKIADRLVGSDHPAPTGLTLSVSTAAGCGVASTNGTVVTLCAEYLRTHPSDMNVFVHEASHVIQHYTSAVPGGLVEGLADWAADWATGHVNPKPALSSSYDAGYDDTSYFLSWIIETTKAANLVRDLNVAAYRGASTEAVYRQDTGQTVGQLWSKMSGHLVTSPGPLIGPANKCADLAYGNTGAGTAIQLLACYGGWAQQFVYVTSAADTSAGLIHLHWVTDKCLVATAGVSGATPRVVLGACDDTSAAARWVHTADGGLLNSALGRCMRPLNGATADSTPLELVPCRSAATDAAQRWSLPPA